MNNVNGSDTVLYNNTQYLPSKNPGCWYKQTHVLVAISQRFLTLLLFFFRGGGPKSILSNLFRNKKIFYTFNGVNMTSEAFSIQKV